MKFSDNSKRRYSSGQCSEEMKDFIDEIIFDYTVEIRGACDRISKTRSYLTSKELFSMFIEKVADNYDRIVEKHSSIGAGFYINMIRNLACDVDRKKKKERELKSEYKSHIEIINDIDFYMEEAEPSRKEKLLNRFREVWPKLKQKYQHYLEMKYFEGLSHQQIASKECISAKAVNSTLQRARNSLKKLMIG